MATRKKQKGIGSSVEDFLAGEGILDEATDAAVNAVLAWQIAEAMKRGGMTKTAMSKLLGTSRMQLDRWLDPAHDKITVGTLKKVADKLGKRLVIEFA
jgi:antitoxin HicB